MSTAPAVNTSAIQDTGDAIANLLLGHGLITDKQLRHARRVRAKLAQPKTLLNTMMELEFFTSLQLNAALQGGGQSIRIGDLLVELGDITGKELDIAIRMQNEPAHKGKKVGEILIDQRYIKEQRLIDVLANHLGFLHIEPDFPTIDRTLFTGVSHSMCEQNGLLPVLRLNDAIVVVCTDPNNQDTLRIAEQLLHHKVVLAITSQFALRTALHKFKASSNPRAMIHATNDDTAVMRLVDEILQAAITMKASDIHFEPLSDKLRIRFRYDSMLWLFRDVSNDLAPNLIARLKILSKANIAERRRHQDGKIEYSDPGSGQIIDIRCSFYISVHGEKACLRLLNRRTELLNIEEIGMAPAVLERFKYEALEVPTGVVMITGPTGSGKTTTLYSCIDYLNDEETSIITAEEPVEYVIDGITQCSLNPKIDMTFAETLRHMVRQDPDVIVLGEIRDRESAEAAIQAALTGHKVLTTFHTEDTIGGLLRLMNMNIETFLISSTVVSVLAQRLLRKVCESCAQPYRPSPIQLQRAGIRGEDLRYANFTQGAGCETCKYTGYYGRISVFELLVLDEKVKEAILSHRASYDIRRISIESSGLITLLEDGLEKASRGMTSIAEVLRMLPRTDKPRPLLEIRRLSRSTDV